MMLMIKQSELQLAYQVCADVPEFDPPYSWAKWQERLEGRRYLCLVAFLAEKPIGCKVGYFADDHFYSWVGGVVPEYRQRGVARRLASEMEKYLAEAGVHVMRMKTQQQFGAMLQFALGNGFKIIGQENVGAPNRHEKIVLEKKL